MECSILLIIQELTALFQKYQTSALWPLPPSLQPSLHPSHLHPHLRVSKPQGQEASSTVHTGQDGHWGTGRLSGTRMESRSLLPRTPLATLQRPYQNWPCCGHTGIFFLSQTCLKCFNRMYLFLNVF